MASVKDFRNKPLSEMSYDELTNYINTAEANGFSRSTSKDLGKAEDLRKVLKPQNYGDETVASAKTKLLNSTTPETQSKLGLASTSTGTTSTSSSNLSDLEKQLADKQAALTKAMSDINDNPWYSEATRVGKLAKLQQIANADITNLQNQINSQKASEQQNFENDLATKNYNLNVQKANQPNTTVSYQTDASGKIYAVTINTLTGQVINKAPVGDTYNKPSSSGSSSATKADYSSQMVDAMNQIIKDNVNMGISYEGGGNFLTINQARPLIEQWIMLGFTENDWWSRFGSFVYGGKPK